jgi:hypothetical protein
VGRACRGARCRPSRCGCRPPTPLPEPVHQPAMIRPTTAPTVGTRSALRGALSQANSRSSSTPSSDRTPCASRSRCVSGPWRGDRVPTMAFPSDPEMARWRVPEAPRCALSTVPRTKLAAHPARCSKRCMTSSPGRGCRSAMMRPTPAPTVGTRLALRGAISQANSRPSSTPFIDRTACVPRAHADVGAGHALSPATRAPRTR